MKLDPDFIKKYGRNVPSDTPPPPDPPPGDPPTPPPAPPPPPFAIDTPFDDNGAQVVIAADGNAYIVRGDKRNLITQPSQKVKTAQQYLQPKGNEFAEGQDRYRVSKTGGLEQFHPQSGQYFDLTSDEILSLPQTARTTYARLLEPQQAGMYDSLRQNAEGWLGGRQPTPEEIAAARQSVEQAALAGRTQQRGVNLGGYVVDSPEAYDQARQHAMQTGNQKALAAMEGVQFHPGAEGGYIVYTPTPIKGQYTQQVIQPDNKQQQAWSWADDPHQVDMAAEQRANVDLRRQWEKQTGGARFNDEGVRIIKDYVDKFAKTHRAALIAGEMLGEPPERVVGALRDALASGDRAGAEKIVQGMQTALAEHVAGGYEYLKPGFTGMTVLQNGDNFDYSPGSVPAKNMQQYDVKTTNIQDPNKLPRAKKEPNPVHVSWQTTTGADKPYHEAHNENTALSGVNNPAYEAVTRSIDNGSYLDANKQMENPVVGGKRHQGNLRRGDAAKMEIESLMKDEGVRTAMKQATVQSLVNVVGELERAITPEAVDAKGTAHGRKMTNREYFEKMREYFGEPTADGGMSSELMDSAKIDTAAGTVTVTKDGKQYVRRLWNDKTIAEAIAKGADAVNADPNKYGALGKTLQGFNKKGMEFGAQEPIAIDARLKDVVPTLTRNMASILQPHFRKFIEQNPEYFDTNLKKGLDENHPYVDGEAQDAAALSLAQQAILEMMTESMNTMGKSAAAAPPAKSSNTPAPNPTPKPKPDIPPFRGLGL